MRVWMMTASIGAIGALVLLSAGCAREGDSAAPPESAATQTGGVVGAWSHTRSGPDDMNLNWDVRADGTVAVTSPSDTQSASVATIYGWRELPEGGYELHTVPDSGGPGTPFRVNGDTLIFSTTAGDMAFQRAS